LALVKLAVSAILVALVVRRFSLDGLRSELAATNWLALAVPFALVVGANLLGAWQWFWLSRAAGVSAGFWPMLRAYAIGLFLNNFMLGNVGGDVFKIYAVGRGSGEVARVAGATIVDRMVGLSALCGLALVAALVEMRRGHVPLEQTLLVAGFSLGIMGPAAVLLHPRHGESVARGLARLPLGRLSGKLQRLLDQLRAFRLRPAVLNGAFMVSLAIQAARVAAHFCVGLAMGWSLHASDMFKFLLVIPILGLVIALPISFGGWGVREWAGVALFAPLGRDGPEAVALLALTATLTLIASLAGAVALVVGPAMRAQRGDGVA
jgi:uncharacterized protein (TIRG00374 family)